MKCAVLVVAAFGLSATAALAADLASSGSPRVACKADVEKLCSGVQPGGGRIGACLKQNEAQVSTACKDALSKARQKRTTPAPGAAQSSPQG
jgi:hypothetical protein